MKEEKAPKEENKHYYGTRDLEHLIAGYVMDVKYHLNDLELYLNGPTFKHITVEELVKKKKAIIEHIDQLITHQNRYEHLNGSRPEAPKWNE